MEKEIEKLQKILKKDPSNFQTRRELAILLADNGFLEEALSNLQYLTKYFPEDAELQYNIGILYEKLKDLSKAKEAYQNAIKLDPQEDFYYNLGEVLVSLEDWDEAINAFRTVLKTDSKDGNCYFNLGLCYLNKEETNLATDYFQQAINLNPNDLFAHFYLGNIYQSNGLTNFATESYKKVLSISPDYSWAYFNLGSIAYRNENFEEAKDYLLKTIEYNKYDFEAYKLLTKILIQQNEIDEIITILKTRIEEEGNGDLCYILSQVYKHINNLQAYRNNLKNAIKNYLTLTYPIETVKKELYYIQSQIGDSDETDSSEDEIEEYNNGFEEEEYEDNTDDEIIEDFDDDNDEYIEDVEENIEDILIEETDNSEDNTEFEIE